MTISGRAQEPHAGALRGRASAKKCGQFISNRDGLFFWEKVATEGDPAAVHIICKIPEWRSHVQDGTPVRTIFLLTSSAADPGIVTPKLP